MFPRFNYFIFLTFFHIIHNVIHSVKTKVQISETEFHSEWL